MSFRSIRTSVIKIRVDREQLHNVINLFPNFQQQHLVSKSLSKEKYQDHRVFQHRLNRSFEDWAKLRQLKFNQQNAIPEDKNLLCIPEGTSLPGKITTDETQVELKHPVPKSCSKTSLNTVSKVRTLNATEFSSLENGANSSKTSLNINSKVRALDVVKTSSSKEQSLLRVSGKFKTMNFVKASGDKDKTEMQERQYPGFGTTHFQTQIPDQISSVSLQLLATGKPIFTKMEPLLRLHSMDHVDKEQHKKYAAIAPPCSFHPSQEDQDRHRGLINSVCLQTWYQRSRITGFARCMDCCPAREQRRQLTTLVSQGNSSDVQIGRIADELARVHVLGIIRRLKNKNLMVPVLLDEIKEVCATKMCADYISAKELFDIGYRV